MLKHSIQVTSIYPVLFMPVEAKSEQYCSDLAVVTQNGDRTKGIAEHQCVR